MATKLTSPVQLFAVDLLTNSATKTMDFGAYGETSDGRGFRYCGVGAVSTVAGKVYQGVALDATNLQPSGGITVAAAAAIGATTVTISGVTVSAALATALAGGYLSVDVTPGQGYLYKIASVGGTSNLTITLDDPLVVALTTSSKVILVQHPYSAVVIEPGTPTSVIAGVAPSIITNGNYGWMQTYGPASVLFTGTGAAGKAVGSLTGGTSGSSAPAIAATNILGYHMATGITGEYAFVYLTIH